MRFNCLLLLVLALSSCGLTPKVETRVQRVYCLTPEQLTKLVQAEPSKIGQHLDPNLQVQNKQLKTQNVLVRKYADGLLEVLGGCTGNAQQPS
jgi:hypothetical protein